MKCFRILILPFLISSLGRELGLAAPASYETQLIKLSKSIKGEPPSLQERRALELAVRAGSAEDFLKKKSKEYLSDDKFVLKLKQKVDELIRVVPQTASQMDPNYISTSVGSSPSAYDYFVQNLISQNMSWNNLLTGKSYTSFYSENGFGLLKEDGFFNRLNPQHTDSDDIIEVIGSTIQNTGSSPSYYRTQTHVFSNDDQRVAGILTTPRFFGRYTNTALNKNRRRAAAVFRVFLCDTMIPTAPVQNSNTESIDYNTILADHQNVTEDQIRKSSAGNIHGQQSDCMACHKKLDPLGQTFGFSASTLGVKPSPGSLRFKGYDGRSVDIALRGLGDLGEHIVKQPEFEKCQVSHFWRWYIGKDVPLTSAREAELVKAFNQVERKPKDFIAYLVSLPEFKEKPQILTEDQVLTRRVVKIFKNCNSCHDSRGEDVWDLTDLPYASEARVRANKIQELREILDIEGGGQKADMPPKSSLWQLSLDEFETIKKWMNRGAPDFAGTPQIPPRGAQ